MRFVKLIVDFILLLMLVMAGFLLIMVVVFRIASGKRDEILQAQCEGKGGFYYSSRYSDELCIKRDGLIQLKDQP